jgi:hypothetical protein
LGVGFVHEGRSLDAKAGPKVEPINHIKVARSYQQNRDPCLPDEAPLDSLRARQTVLLTASDYRQNGDAANPDD